MHGIFKEEFAQVVDLFEQQGRAHPLGGSSLAVCKDGELVVNVWQGEAKPGEPWTEDTVSDVFSSTKGIVSILAAKLADEGVLDLDAKVTEYWPEFGQGGKENITVKMVLQHKAGLSAVRRDLTFDEVVDGHTITDELAKQEPLWEPGTSHGYHALTFGNLVSRIILGATGLTANDYLQKYVTKPLGIDMWIGTPAAVLPRVAPLISDGNFISANPVVGTDLYWVEKAMTMGGGLPVDPTSANGFNNPRLLATELAGANGVTNAHGLAKIYSAAVVKTDGLRLLSDDAIEAACIPASFGENHWHEPVPHPIWGNGFMVPGAVHIKMPGNKGFGHDGLGGQAGWGSLVHRIGFGYTTTFLKRTPDTQKNQQDLVASVNRALGI
jgi:CubicO group peptidase (beta-lactamase class C family)